MKKLLITIFLIGSACSQACGDQTISLAPMFVETANALNVPASVTQAIARVESSGSPWALNIEGRGYIFPSKEKALEKAKEAAAEGRSFDSGVMQVNNFWLKKYGIPLEAAFDPLANIYLGSWILKQEMARRGQTWDAVGAYHSPNEEKGRRYAEMVKEALNKGPLNTPRTITTSKPTQPGQLNMTNKRQIDCAPLIVARRNEEARVAKVDQPVNAVPFVQRLSRKI